MMPASRASIVGGTRNIMASSAEDAPPWGPQPLHSTMAAFLFPGPMALFQMPVARGEWARLYAEEEISVSRAVPTRRREFAAGRACARRGLEALAMPVAAIPADADRVPLWPEGVVGSISHSAETAIAALGSTEDWAAIGIDIERRSDVGTDIARTVCTPEEWEQNALHKDFIALMFSAKESVFKCVFPLERRFLDFQNVVITLRQQTAAGSHGQFDAEFANSSAEDRTPLSIEGRWWMDGEAVYTSAFRRADQKEEMPSATRRGAQDAATHPDFMSCAPQRDARLTEHDR